MLEDHGAMTRLNGPPGRLGLSRVQSGVNLLLRPLPYLMRLKRTYGNVCAISPDDPRVIFAFGSDEARQVLTSTLFLADSFRHLRLAPGSPMMLLTSGLLRLNGIMHRQHRHAMQHAFSPRHVSAYTDTILRFADEMIADWMPNSTIDLHEELARLVTRVSLATMAGVEDADAARRLNAKMMQLASAAGNPLTVLIQAPLPGTPFRRMTRIAEEVEGILRDLIHQRRTGTGGPDLLSQLVISEEEPAYRLKNDELLGEAYTALCHDSVASSLFWTLLLLDQHRKWWHELQSEVAAKIDKATPSSVALEEMPILDQIVRESMRLMPPAAFAVRYADKGAKINNHPIREGAMVIVSPFVIHRSEKMFSEPFQFHPERWRTVKPAQNEYFPFGLGKHNCIGRNLALLEIKLVLSRIMQHAPIIFPANTIVDPVVRISLVPKSKVLALVTEPGAVHPPPYRIGGTIHHIVNLPNQEAYSGGGEVEA